LSLLDSYYPDSQTDGSNLNNGRVFVVGQRCGIPVMLAMPMMMLPCRASLLEALDVLIDVLHKTFEKEVEETSQVSFEVEVCFDDDGPSDTSVNDIEDLTTTN
jgi:hypothetical protein